MMSLGTWTPVALGILHTCSAHLWMYKSHESSATRCRDTSSTLTDRPTPESLGPGLLRAIKAQPNLGYQVMRSLLRMSVAAESAFKSGGVSEGQMPPFWAGGTGLLGLVMSDDVLACGANMYTYVRYRHHTVVRDDACVSHVQDSTIQLRACLDDRRVTLGQLAAKYN